MTKQNKKEKEQEVYLVIGSNNFWYATCDTLKEAKEIKKHVLKYKSKNDVGNPEYEDPESRYNPFTPEEIYIYKSIEIN